MPLLCCVRATDGGSSILSSSPCAHAMPILCSWAFSELYLALPFLPFFLSFAGLGVSHFNKGLDSMKPELILDVNQKN